MILARGLDVTIENIYKPEQNLEVGDTVKVTLENMIPPLFKMSAIYNPSGVNFVCKANGVDYTARFGQYMVGSSFNIKLQEEDAGTYQITEGALTTRAWGTIDGAHRKLTRNSMAGYWNGGDNPNIDYGKMAYIPEISFEVEGNDEYEESVFRSAGLLKALGVINQKEGNPMVSGTAMFASSHADVEQNKNRPTSVSGTSALQRHVQVGADLLQKDEKAKLLARYWFGDDRSESVVQEIEFSEAYQETNLMGAKFGKYLENH